MVCKSTFRKDMKVIVKMHFNNEIIIELTAVFQKHLWYASNGNYINEFTSKLIRITSYINLNNYIWIIKINNVSTVNLTRPFLIQLHISIN